jgi:hypothetical protein
MGSLMRISNPKGDMATQYLDKGEDIQIYKGKNNIQLAIKKGLKEVILVLEKVDVFIVRCFGP